MMAVFHILCGCSPNRNYPWCNDQGNGNDDDREHPLLAHAHPSLLFGRFKGIVPRFRSDVKKLIRASPVPKLTPALLLRGARL
jgi:hypothetical protein